MRTIDRTSFAGGDSTWAAEPFRVDVQPDRQRAYVSPRGELDLSTAAEVAEEIQALVVRGFDAIVIDLRATSFIDSTGVHLLLRQAARTDVRVTVIDGPHAVSRVFDLAGVRQLLPFEGVQ